MRILLSNDDGVLAPGIQSLYHALKDIADVTMIAPLQERSTTGHTLTLDHPIRIQQIEEKIFGISGYPADCILMGLGKICKKAPDLVISGINRGANLGQDVYYSGTVAAAREACFHGLPSIAVSLDIGYNSMSKPENYHFDTAANFVADFLKNDGHLHISKGGLFNINVPNLPKEKILSVEKTFLGYRDYSEEVDERIDCRGRSYYWLAGTYRGFVDEKGSDCSAVNQKKISITPLHFQHTFTDENVELSDFLKSLKVN